ncbi:MAG: hypothetical protein ACP5RH_13835 [Leptodesmis sp.]|uniref:hypothetical protein n=1 Tax=Leptodesmis sp. TaxID=3100501 RepID=UPI003D115584
MHEAMLKLYKGMGMEETGLSDGKLKKLKKLTGLASWEEIKKQKANILAKFGGPQKSNPDWHDYYAQKGYLIYLEEV